MTPMMPGTRPPRGGRPVRDESGPRPHARIGPRRFNTRSICAAGGLTASGGSRPPRLSTWDELASRRWGPAIGDPTPGIIIDGTARGPMLTAADGADAIQRESGP